MLSTMEEHRIFYNLNIASRNLLNPLTSPGWRFKGISEILCFVYNLTIAKLHNAHRVC